MIVEDGHVDVVLPGTTKDGESGSRPWHVVRDSFLVRFWSHQCCTIQDELAQEGVKEKRTRERVADGQVGSNRGTLPSRVAPNAKAQVPGESGAVDSSSSTVGEEYVKLSQVERGHGVVEAIV